MISGIKPHQSEQRVKHITESPDETALGMPDYQRVRRRSEAICAPLNWKTTASSP